MPIYEYQGKQYDIETTDHAEAKNKILAYLGTPAKVDIPTPSPEKTSIMQDIGIGLENVAHKGKTALDLMAGAAATYAGYQDDADKIYADMEARQKAREAELAKLDQGTGGKIVSGITGIVPALAAAPLVGVPAALGGMAGMSAVAGAGENVGKGASVPAATGQAMLEAGTDYASMALPVGRGILQGVGLGAGGNVGATALTDFTGRQLLAGTDAAQTYETTPEKLLISGATGAIPGAVFGALGSKHVGKVDATGKIETPPAKTEEITGQDLITRQLQLQETKKKLLEQDIDNLRKQQSTGDIGVEDRILLDQKELELQRVNESIAKLSGQEVGQPLPKTGTVVPEAGIPEHPLEGRVAGEQPAVETVPKTVDENAPARGLEEPTTNEQSVGNVLPYREENVSPLSDVPPHLQREDAAISGIDPAKVIEEAPKTENQKVLNNIDEKISQLEEQRQTVEDLIAEYHENPNRNSPQDLAELNSHRDTIESQLEGLYAGREKKLNDVKVEEPQAGRLTPEQRNQRAQEVIAEGVAEGKTPEQIAKRIVSVFAVEDKGIHYVGDSKLQKFITNTVESLNKLTGLDDKVIIVHAPELASGKYTAIGNTHVLFVSDVRKSNYSFLNTVPERLRSQAALTANIGHEYGHYFHVKLVQKYGKNHPLLQQLDKEFSKYVDSLDPRKVETVSATPLSEGYLGKNEYVRATGYFEKFPEFFAESFNKAILHGTLPKNDFLRNLYTGLRKISNQVHKELEKLGIRVSKEDFTSQYFNEYFNANRKYLEDSGRQMSDNGVKASVHNVLGQKGIDNIPSAETINNQLETFYKTSSQDFEPINTVKVVEEQKKVEDIGWFSTNILANAFGSPQLVQILSNSPIISAVYKAIRNADAESSRIVKSIMEGTTTYKNWKGEAVKKGFLTTLKKFQDMDSPAIVMQKLHNQDFAAIEQVFRKGFDESLDYAESLVKYGSTLSDDQKHAFTIFAEMFKKQYDEVVKLQQQQGKKHILPYRKGWYPSVRKGDFYIDLSFNGEPLYRQHVRTQLEADRLAKLAKNSGKYENVEITTGKNDDTRFEAEQRDYLRDAILQELIKRGEKTALDHVESLLDKLYERGGKLGKHHEQRMNILGYKGTELFGDANSRGLSFKEALDSSVKEYAGSLRKMMVSRNTDAILKTPEGLEQSHPNTMEAAQQMVDMSLSKVDSKVSAFDNMVNQTFDKIFFKAFGKESRLPVYERVSGLLTHLFYTTTLTMKPAFWIGQALTSPTSLRHIFREANLANGLLSAGKGTMNLFKPSEDFLKCVYWLSQNTETYHPQFANELTSFKMPELLADKSFASKVVNLVSGETPSQGADSFSRYWTSAMMYEHYKSKGLTGKKLYEAVSNATDTTMVQYGRRHRAAYISKLGIVGEAMAPLHTFSTAQWGNFVADSKLAMKTGNVKPLVATFLTTIMLGGVIGAPLVAEYEIIRKAFDLEDTLPSPVEWAVSKSPRLLSHGVMSYSGFDLGSTMRWSPIVSGIAEANGTIMDLFPALKFVGKSASSAYTIGKYNLGGDVSEAEYRTSMRNVMPKGPLTGLMEDIKFDATNRAMVPTGGRGYGLVPQTGEERAADYLGTRTMESALESKQFGIEKEQEQKRTQRIQKEIDIAVDALKSGNKDSYSKAINKLLELGVKPDAITNQMKTAIQSRGRGLLERFVFGASGKGTSSEQQRKLENIMEYR